MRLNQVIVCLIVLSFSTIEAQIRFPRLIGDNAVLQRDKELRLFGWASPSEKIRLTFNGKDYTTVANGSGEWELILPAQKAGGPYDMTFVGNSSTTLRNILFGDVWLCSGQSNMEMTVNNVKDKYPEVIANSSNPFIRHFAVPQKYDFKKPNGDLSDGQWSEANPENVLQFSAVAYFFARQLYEKHRVPIGLLNASLGGSPAEAWMSEDALRKFPSHLAEALKFRSDSLISAVESSDRKRIGEWYSNVGQKDIGNAGNWKSQTLEDNDWHTMSLPGYWPDQKIVSGNGVVWFRKRFHATKAFVGKPLKLLLGRVVDQDSVFINGAFVGTTSYQYPQRRYPVKEGVVNEGENTIVIKVINQSGRGGFVADKPYCLVAGGDTLDLRGEWKYKSGASMPALGSQTFIRWKPLGLYNGMIAPLTKFPIKGVIWYQGESNTGRALEYKTLFPALINNWREKWNSEFPFLFVQLTNFMDAKTQPSESGWAELRQAQYETLQVPKTGMAVTIDIGEWNDIHPLDKKTVGDRLALQARKLVYGEKNLVASGPEPRSAKFGEKDVVIQFDNAKDGLVTKGNAPVRHIALSQDGKNFVWANTEIKGTTLRVWHDSIKNPKVVRYAWADNPDTANLVNSAGLPATPFELKAAK